MREYVLMTDSCCDLPDQMAKDLQLEVLPLTMHMDGQDYPNTLDGAAISNEEFYRRIRAGKMATTSAVNVGQFEDAMSAILEQGKDILCISFSSALSTTYQSACIAAETVLAKHPEGRIRVIDSLSASLGQGLLMYLTAHKKLEENLTLDQLGDWVEENKLHVCHWFTVDDLNYLKKGGRVSAATALVGTMLSIKPIMHTSDEGKLTVVGKARGRKSSLNTLIDTVGRLGINLQDQVMFICQADCQAEAEAVAAQLKQRYGVKEVYIKLHRPRHRQPYRPQHHGPVLCGNGALSMKWLELKIDAAPAGLEPVSALLEDLGITGLVIDDEGDFQDFLEHNHAYWDYVDDQLMQEKKGLCRITFYLEDSPDGYNTLAQVRMALSRVKQEHPEYGRLAADHGEHGGRRLGEQLEAVLQAHGDRRPADRHPGVGERRCAGGPGGPAAEPGPHLRHRQPRHHPPVPDGPGKAYHRRPDGAGPGLRQRHSVHCRPAAGGGPGRGLRH